MLSKLDIFLLLLLLLLLFFFFFFFFLLLLLLSSSLLLLLLLSSSSSSSISGKMLKHLGACSRAVLLKIFYHSWMKGVVPAVWKEAIVIPVPKKGKDKKNPRSYRPISLPSCVGKLLERMVNRRLINHLESNNVLSPTKQATGSSEAQRTNLPTLPRTSKMHSRRKERFWQSSSISQIHMTRSGKRDFL